jgi:hypothetical protein
MKWCYNISITTTGGVKWNTSWALKALNTSVYHIVSILTSETANLCLIFRLGPTLQYHTKKILLFETHVSDGLWWFPTRHMLVPKQNAACLWKKLFPLDYSVIDSVSCVTKLGNWPQINYCLFYFRSQIHWWKHQHNIKLFLYELSVRIHFYICTCIEQCWHPVCRVQTGTWND